MSERLPSAWHRKFDRLLRELGYTFDSGHGKTHLTYRHPEHPGVFTVACTPGDVTSEVNLLTQLRRRHPDHPALARNSRSRPASERKHRARRNRNLGAAARFRLVRESLDGDAVATFIRPESTGCVDCGRRWLSDLNPLGRCCPQCGGEVVLGRSEERWLAA